MCDESKRAQITPDFHWFDRKWRLRFGFGKTRFGFGHNSRRVIEDNEEALTLPGLNWPLQFD